MKIICPGCGKEFVINSLGRKSYDIPVTNVCNAVRACSGNYHTAARVLFQEFGIEVTPGFVANRIHRAGLTLREVMNGKGG